MRYRLSISGCPADPVLQFPDAALSIIRDILEDNSRKKPGQILWIIAKSKT